jgi:hypothetical protein
MTHGTRRLTIAIILIGLPGAPGCRSADSETDARARQPIETSKAIDEVTLIVRADARRLRVGDALNLTVTVDAPADLAIAFPAAESELGDFLIRDWRDRAAVTAAGRRGWVRAFVLEAMLSGSRTIPPIEITCHSGDAARSAPAAGGPTRDVDDPADPDAAEPDGAIVVASDPLAIEVTSALGDDPATASLRDVKDPLELDRPVSFYVWAGGVAVLLAAAAAGIAWAIARHYQSGPATARRVAPDVWAMDQLRALSESDLLGRGLIHDYYMRLSEIVRGYIEDRFGVRAPEQTTDEFLAEARMHGALGDAHKSLLADFLMACDMVKFARYEPPREESDRAFDAARDFVRQTAPRANVNADGTAGDVDESTGVSDDRDQSGRAA